MKSRGIDLTSVLFVQKTIYLFQLDFNSTQVEIYFQIILIDCYFIALLKYTVHKRIVTQS
jgi:hypothetical protein